MFTKIVHIYISNIYRLHYGNTIETIILMSMLWIVFKIKFILLPSEAA